MKKKKLFNEKKIENVMNNLTSDELNKIIGGKVSGTGSITISSSL